MRAVEACRHWLRSCSTDGLLGAVAMRSAQLARATAESKLRRVFRNPAPTLQMGYDRSQAAGSEQ